ncbi:MAG: 50S ribosomal protein L11 methyltransferase [Chlorobiota bacterium]
MKKYISIRYSIKEENQDLFIGLISDLNFTGIEQNFDTLTINFPANIYNDEIADKLHELSNSIHFKVEEISREEINEENWNSNWESQLEPVIISDDLIISPTSKSNNITDYKYVIKIDPKMSFGTGYHATTRLASKLILSSVESGTKWLDAGTGTGVLAILASMLEAKELDAFDIDTWSVENTKENLEINEIRNVNVFEADLYKLELDMYDGIIANMFSNLLIDNMNKLSNSINYGGSLICTGILKYDKDKVLESALKNNFKLVEELNEDEWVAYKFEKLK